MALGTFVAGAFTSTWNAVALGIMKDGFRLRFQGKESLINKSDAYGDSLIDTILRGGDYTMTMEGLEYKAGTTGAMWPYATFGAFGVMGRLGSAVAKSLVLTSVTGTPAVATPATLTASLAKLSPNNNVELLYHTELRTVPLQLDLLPSDSGSGLVWLVQT